MTLKQTTRQQKSRPIKRDTYSAPKLKVFGPVGALTQAGSGTTSEVMGNGMTSMSPNQRA
jgi:hypothetical protein